MPRARYTFPGSHAHSSQWKKAFTAVTYQITQGGITYIVAADGFGTHLNSAVLGVNDDIIISVALVYINALGGGELYCEEGTYTLTATVTWYANICLKGVGYNTHWTAAGNFHLITIAGISNVCIEDMRLSGTSTGHNVDCVFCDSAVLTTDIHLIRIYVTNSDRYGFRFEGTLWVRDVWIIECHITNTDLDGISAEGLSRSMIIGNYIYLTGQSGINIVNQYDYGVISGNVIFGCGLHGLTITMSMSYLAITGNVTGEHTGSGINVVLLNFGYVSITGNISFESHLSGIYVSGSQFLISSNFIYDNAENGITLGGGCIDGLISSNDIVGLSGLSQQDGIELETGAKNILIIGNYIINQEVDGISLVGNNDDCNINGNYLNGNGAYGIDIEAATCERNLVKDNYYLNNVTSAIRDLGTDTRTHEDIIDPEDRDATIVAGDHPAAQMLDDVSTTVRFGFGAKSEFQELVSARVVIVPVANGTLRRQVSTQFGKVCSGEAYNAHSDAIAAGNVDGMTANEIECIDVSAALTGLAARDTVGMRFIRDATAGSGDTIAGTVWVKELRIRFV